MKAYLYCTKAKPYLKPNGAIGTISTKYNLNGFVCFECEINKVEEIRYGLLTDCFTTNTLGQCSLLNRACLTEKRIKDYYPRYALYLKNVKKIDNPFTVSQAPQNMMNYKHCNCVLISVQPQHLANIANGLKDIEVRKSILNELKEIIK